MRQHASAYVSIRQQVLVACVDSDGEVKLVLIQHKSAYVSMRQHTSAYGLACVDSDGEVKLVLLNIECVQLCQQRCQRRLLRARVRAGGSA
jgi:hypothetical protein